MKLIFTRLMVVFLLAALMLSGFGSNMVLCLGEDGHISIETAADGKCCRPDTDVHEDCTGDRYDSVCASAAEQCGFECVDIPIPTLHNSGSAAARNSHARTSSILIASSVHTVSSTVSHMPLYKAGSTGSTGSRKALNHPPAGG